MEYKFKALDKNSNKIFFFDLFDSNRDDSGRLYIDGYGKVYEEDLEIYLFTGIKDKNGTDIYKGDNLIVNRNYYGTADVVEGIVGLQDGTFCLELIKQPERAKEQGYVERIRLWNDGEHDHYSLEIIDSFEMEVKDNNHDSNI